jgi:hypothetical protein
VFNYLFVMLDIVLQETGKITRTYKVFLVFVIEIRVVLSLCLRRGGVSWWFFLLAGANHQHQPKDDFEFYCFSAFVPDGYRDLWY